jgi:hypothetical protein
MHMKRYHFAILLFALSILLTGCLQVFDPVPTNTPPPTAIPLPTQVPPTLTEAPIEPTPTQLITTCNVDPLVSACAAPKVDERDKYCVEKMPYVQFAMAPGVTFEPSDPGLKCADQGVRGGEQMIACTGQSLIAYDLKICNAACNSSALIEDPTKCAEGYGYSAEAGCCWPMPTTDSGCVLIKVNLGACR